MSTSFEDSDKLQLKLVISFVRKYVWNINKNKGHKTCIDFTKSYKFNLKAI